ncbi:MAG: response regulator [Armatimonadetes bacterium]|nr:response regulator [Armatimonadota bacterium]
MRILIVDDEPVSLELLAAVLTRANHEVISVRDGRQAWEQLVREPIPLVITDSNMPDLDGLELCRRIRAHDDPLYTCVILLTAVGRDDGFLTAMDAGADDFITKPFKREELLARVRVAERVLNLQKRHPRARRAPADLLLLQEHPRRSEILAQGGRLHRDASPHPLQSRRLSDLLEGARGAPAQGT